MSEPRTVKVAAVQAEPVVLDREATVAKACRLIAETASNGAQLAVFPELFIPTYVNGTIWGRGLAPTGSPRARSAWLRLWQNSVEIPPTRRPTSSARRPGRPASPRSWACTSGSPIREPSKHAPVHRR
jgi:hypothetical protein